ALELESSCQVMRGVNEPLLHRTVEELLQHWPELRVHHSNDPRDTHTWRKAPQVSHTGLGDDDDGVALSLADVRSARNNRTKCAARGNRWGSEGGDVAVTAEVTRTTGTVHDAGAANVGGVDVAVNISLNHAVGRDQTNTTDNLWVVRNLLWTQDDVLSGTLRLFVDLVCILWRQRK